MMSKGPHSEPYLARGRKIVETAGSQIDRLMPGSIRAITARGLEWKVMFFVLAYSVSFVV